MESAYQAYNFELGAAMPKFSNVTCTKQRIDDRTCQCLKADFVYDQRQSEAHAATFTVSTGNKELEVVIVYLSGTLIGSM